MSEIDKIPCIRLNLFLNGTLLYYNIVKDIHNSTLWDQNVWQSLSCIGRFNKSIKNKYIFKLNCKNRIIVKSIYLLQHGLNDQC